MEALIDESDPEQQPSSPYTDLPLPEPGGSQQALDTKMMMEFVRDASHAELQVSTGCWPSLDAVRRGPRLSRNMRSGMQSSAC